MILLSNNVQYRSQNKALSALLYLNKFPFAFQGNEVIMKQNTFSCKK